jgi:aminoglycoside phosphotransferase (APT) family kinase protein
MKWLAEWSAAALGEALQAVAPELSGCPVTVPVPDPAAKADPLWWSSSAAVGERFIAKFAWSRPAALRLATEIGLLTALAREPRVPFLPPVVASSTDPLLLITRRVAGASLFEVVDSIDRDRAGQQLARFLAALHHPAARERAEAAVGKLTGAQLPPATTSTLRERFGTWARPDQRHTVIRWCDWADAALASPGPAVLVHGDLHGDNQVWDHGELRLVVDFETAGAAEPEYDLRTFPGPGMGPGVELLTAVMRHYQQSTGRQLSADRSWPGICATPSATRCGAAKPAFRCQTTGHHQSGSTTWPRASAHSASTPGATPRNNGQTASTKNRGSPARSAPAAPQ